MVITAETPVRDIAVEQPSVIPALEQFGIDYCCGGQHTLAEACVKRDLQIASVLEELERRQEDKSVAEAQWQKATLKELTKYIVQRHHVFTREQLGLILDLAAKVERRHGSSHPEIFQVSEALGAISSELTNHFLCEEDILFPYIAQLEDGLDPALPPTFNDAEQPVARMMSDHSHTGNELRLVREITNNYRLPADACTTYRALYSALENLEKDLHQHIHLENNVLFPRALKQTRKTE